MDEKQKPTLSRADTQVVTVFWFALIDKELGDSLLLDGRPRLEPWESLGIPEAVIKRCFDALQSREGRDAFKAYQACLYRVISEDPHPNPPCRTPCSRDVLQEVLHFLLLFAKERPAEAK